MESIIAAHNPHIIVVTETWLHQDISDHELIPNGFRIYRNDRDGRGGGVAIFLKESLRASRLPNVPGLESVVLKLFLEECNLIVVGIYRPPSSDCSFAENLNEFLCLNTIRSGNLLLAGDFNLPAINWSDDFPEALTDASQPFVDLVILRNLTQLVKLPTRTQQTAVSVLDLFLVSNELLRRNPRIDIFEGISDHKIVSLTLEMQFCSKLQVKERTIPLFTHASDVDVLDLLDNSFSDFSALYESTNASVEQM